MVCRRAFAVLKAELMVFETLVLSNGWYENPNSMITLMWIKLLGVTLKLAHA